MPRAGNFSRKIVLTVVTHPARDKRTPFDGINRLSA